MLTGGSNGNGAFIKRSLTFSIMTMFLLTAFLSIYLPNEGSPLQQELDELTSGYAGMVGADPTSEEVWALSGIYTPYGKDAQGDDSTAWLSTKDGWVAGARIESYSPAQLRGPEEGQGLNSGKESYKVAFDADTGLYYYIEAGDDLKDGLTLGDPDNPQTGTLYTAVTMDIDHQSDLFFTPGGKVQNENGIYYNFSGWRYAFAPLRDYKASNDLNVDKATTSLSMVWYDYYGTEGLSGQLMLAGDEGVSYITAQEIVESFNSASFTSKFTMIFNGIDMNVYIRLNPYAIQFEGYSVQKAFDEGFWTIMVTSPSVSTGTADFTLESIAPDRIFQLIVDLFTFDMGHYGMSGLASTLCSIFFVVSFYTSLLAISIENEYLLVLVAFLAVFQSLSIIFRGRSDGRLHGDFEGRIPGPGAGRCRDSGRGALR